MLANELTQTRHAIDDSWDGARKCIVVENKRNCANNANKPLEPQYGYANEQ